MLSRDLGLGLKFGYTKSQLIYWTNNKMQLSWSIVSYFFHLETTHDFQLLHLSGFCLCSNFSPFLFLVKLPLLIFDLIILIIYLAMPLEHFMVHITEFHANLNLHAQSSMCKVSWLLPICLWIKSPQMTTNRTQNSTIQRWELKFGNRIRIKQNSLILYSLFDTIIGILTFNMSGLLVDVHGRPYVSVHGWIPYFPNQIWSFRVPKGNLSHICPTSF